MGETISNAIEFIAVCGVLAVFIIQLFKTLRMKG